MTEKTDNKNIEEESPQKSVKSNLRILFYSGLIVCVLILAFGPPQLSRFSYIFQAHIYPKHPQGIITPPSNFAGKWINWGINLKKIDEWNYIKGEKKPKAHGKYISYNNAGKKNFVVNYVDGMIIPSEAPLSKEAWIGRKSPFDKKFKINLNQLKDFEIKIEIGNPLEAKWIEELIVQIDNPKWAVTPLRFKESLKENKKKELIFKFSFSGDPVKDLFPIPVIIDKAISDGKVLTNSQTPLPINMKEYHKNNKRVGAINSLKRDPKIDGRLNEWNKSHHMGKLFYSHGRTYVNNKTDIFLGYTKDHLYAAYYCQEKNIKTLKKDIKERDKEVWADDSVELLLDINMDRKGYYQMIFNSIGTSFDISTEELDDKGKKIKNIGWNPDLVTKTSIFADHWILEVKIPWKDFNFTPEIGKKIGLELIRSRTNPKETYQWAPTTRGTHVPQMYGTLTFK